MYPLIAVALLFSSPSLLTRRTRTLRQYAAFPDFERSPMMPAVSILIVDDDRFIRESMQVILSDAGYDVVVARDGREMLARLDEAPPEMVLLDMLLPNVDGWEVFSRIRTRVSWAGVPVCIITATTAQIPRGAEFVLWKPFSIGRLLAIVERCCARRLSCQSARARVG
jgi:DNA-binding response OmpR family regulator